MSSPATNRSPPVAALRRPEELAVAAGARSYPALRAREEDCALRTPFQRDRDRIVHSKAFRRLTHKTQVFVAPEGDHYRTRLTHTLEVTTISRTVARALRLNEDLTEAIGLGHDLGHPPFGHIGEEVLDRCLRERFGGGFRHYEHSLRVVDELERDGAGLNLTEQVRDGIARHSGARRRPQHARGPHRAGDRPRRLHQPRHRRRAARRAADARTELPARADRRARRQRLGADRRARARHGRALRARRATSSRATRPARRWQALRKFMFERVYLGPAVRAEHERIAGVVRALFEHYVAHPELLPALPRHAPRTRTRAQRVTDYLAGMTDRYCIRAVHRAPRCRRPSPASLGGMR